MVIIILEIMAMGITIIIIILEIMAMGITIIIIIKHGKIIL